MSHNVYSPTINLGAGPENCSHTIRQITRGDAGPYLALRQKFFSESDFMLVEVCEIAEVTTEMQRRRIDEHLARARSTILIAEVNDTMIGFAFISAGQFQSESHCGYIALGVVALHQLKENRQNP